MNRHLLLDHEEKRSHIFPPSIIGLYDLHVQRNDSELLFYFGNGSKSVLKIAYRRYHISRIQQAVFQTIGVHML